MWRRMPLQISTTCGNRGPRAPAVGAWGGGSGWGSRVCCGCAVFVASVFLQSTSLPYPALGFTQHPPPATTTPTTRKSRVAGDPGAGGSVVPR